MRPRRAAAAAAAALGLGGVAFGAWNSPWLKLQTVQVVGNHHATTAQVERAAALTPGMRLTAVSSAQVSARVSALPWVVGADVTHILPSRVRIAVRERTPAVVVQAGPRSYLVDGAGVVLEEGTAGYPVVTGLPVALAFPGDRITAGPFVAALKVLGALPPDLRARLASISSPSADLISVVLTDNTSIVYGSADSLGDKNYDVATLMAAGHRYVSIDVRAPNRPAARSR